MDVAARIERSVWQGSERVELMVRAVQPLPDELGPAPGVCATPCDASCPFLRAPLPEPEAGEGLAVTAMRDARAGGAIAELTRLAASGQGLLVVVADVARRRAMLDAALHPSRFGLRGALLLSARCSDDALTDRLQLLAEGPYLVVADHATVQRHPSIAQHVPDAVLLDPAERDWRAPAGPRWVRVDGPAEHRFAASVRGQVAAG
jgi:hypothetical protein